MNSLLVLKVPLNNSQLTNHLNFWARYLQVPVIVRLFLHALELEHGQAVPDILLYMLVHK